MGGLSAAAKAFGGFRPSDRSIQAEARADHFRGIRCRIDFGSNLAFGVDFLDFLFSC